MSVPQTPHAATLISTSPSPTSGTGTSSTRTMAFSRKTPARMVLGMGPSERADSKVGLVRVIERQPPHAWLVLRTCRRCQRPPRTDRGNQQAFWLPLCSAYQTSEEVEPDEAVSRSASEAGSFEGGLLDRLLC